MATQRHGHTHTPTCLPASRPAAWQVMNSANLMSLESLEEKQKLSNYFFWVKCAGQVVSVTYTHTYKLFTCTQTHSYTYMYVQRLQLSASVVVKRVTEAVSQVARSEFFWNSTRAHTYTLTDLHIHQLFGSFGTLLVRGSLFIFSIKWRKYR